MNIYINLLRIHLFGSEIKAVHVFVFSVILYSIVYRLTGLIPVNNGAGFDGSVYVNYIIKISQYIPIEDDPYRLSRIGGFIPAVIYAKIRR